MTDTIENIANRLEKLEHVVFHKENSPVFDIYRSILSNESRPRHCCCKELRKDIKDEICIKCKHKKALHDNRIFGSSNINKPVLRKIILYINDNPNCKASDVAKEFHLSSFTHGSMTMAYYYQQSIEYMLMPITQIRMDPPDIWIHNTRDYDRKLVLYDKSILDEISDYGENSIGDGCTGNRVKYTWCSCVPNPEIISRGNNCSQCGHPNHYMLYRNNNKCLTRVIDDKYQS